MLTMNRTLDEKLSTVDNVYLTDSDLFSLERFANSFSVRVKTYNLLRDRSDETTIQALKLLSQQYPELVQKQLQRCKYDMSQLIRYMSLAILRDDEVFFRESLLDWHTNIIHSYNISTECSTAYSLLKAVLEKILPSDSFALIKPYLDLSVSAFMKA
jgi:Phycobilisome protein